MLQRCSWWVLQRCSKLQWQRKLQKVKRNMRCLRGKSVSLWRLLTKAQGGLRGHGQDINSVCSSEVKRIESAEG